MSQVEGAIHLLASVSMKLYAFLVVDKSEFKKHSEYLAIEFNWYYLVANVIDFRHIQKRRKQLSSLLEGLGQEVDVEESCLPSYIHTNVAAAYTAWWRLFRAIRKFYEYAPGGPVLDFGAATGELRHLMPKDIQYDFVEQDKALADILVEEVADARPQSLSELPQNHYACVFALDALEHNDDYPEIIEMLANSLRDDGILILSGPTENSLYKIGRRLAGFDGHYHVTNIYEINRAASNAFQCLDKTSGPWPLPLFVLSAWEFRKPRHL
jgi:2-polyprenyl-3-methyl-5-hydroxy-6-metoxy-1,4-benzoquinol methylase